MSAFLGVISTIFSNKLWRNIIFAVGILLVVIILWVWLAIVFSNKQHQPVITILQSVEYIEELKLVDFYYEEVIFLGDSSRAEKIARKLEHEKAAAYSVYLSEMQRLDSLREVYSKIEMELTQEESIIDSIGRLYEKVQKDYNDLPRLDIRRINKLDEKADRYTPDIKTAYFAWKILRRGKAKKKAKKDLDKLLDEEFETRKKNKDSFQGFLKIAEKEFKVWKKGHKNLLNSAEKAVRKQERQFNNSTKEYERKTEQTKEAVAKAKEIRSKKSPELLIIAPAQVSGMIDMADLKLNIIGDTLLRIFLPEPQLDSVYIEIDSSRYFDINGLASTSRTEGGIYFSVYLQLKAALIESREEVKLKALENGILEKTEEMAIEYFEELGKSFGYQVQVIPASSPSAAGVPDDQEESPSPTEPVEEDTNKKG